MCRHNFPPWIDAEFAMSEWTPRKHLLKALYALAAPSATGNYHRDRALRNDRDGRRRPTKPAYCLTAFQLPLQPSLRVYRPEAELGVKCPVAVNVNPAPLQLDCTEPLGLMTPLQPD